MKLHWYQTWVNWMARKLGAFGTLDTNKALGMKNLRIIELENALAERPIIYIYTPQMPSYEPPSPTTDGKIAAEHMDNKPDWWKRRNPHLVETQRNLPRIKMPRKYTLYADTPGFLQDQPNQDKKIS